MTEPDPIEPPDEDADHDKVRVLHRENQDLADAVTDDGDGDGEDDQPTGYVGVRLSACGVTVKAFGPSVAAVHDVLNHAVTRRFVRELDHQRAARRRARNRTARMRLRALIRKIKTFLNRSDDSPT